MPWFTDSLRSAIAAVNPFQRGYGSPGVDRFFTPQLAFAAYLSSGMLRKVIDIPAADRVREWRDWQADSDQIENLEAEEKRLGIIAKIKAAEVLRGIGGGALILAAPGNLGLPINLRAIGEKGLAAVNVASRWQLQLVDIDDNMASPTFGEPRMFRINGGQTGQQDIHPSRVIPFRGDPIPAGYGVSAEDAYWGASRLERVFAEVQKSDNASQWFAELVKKAKLLRIGIPDLAEMTATTGGQAKLNARIATIAEGESVLNATVFSSAATKDGAGETISDYQITWAGIPAMMDAFDQRVAAVADIPFTRLMGRSPAGMNATGGHDTDNWNKMIAAGQKLELRPCLERLDEVMIPSAGVDPAKVTWRFAPLDTPSEKEEADTFKTTMDAVTALQNTGAIPDVAFAKGVQNLMSEREWVPGLDQALAEIPEDERFGITAEPDDTDPSALQTTNGGKEADPNLAPGGGDGSAAARRRAANDAFFADAQPRPLYVQRKLLNAADLIAWAKSNGFTSTLPADDMHVTVLYSRAAVDPMKMGDSWTGDEKGNLRAKPGGPRAIERLGESAVVLLFASWELTSRHDDMVRAGGSHDYDEYQPHVTLSYEVPDGVDLAAIKPFVGELRFGPELFEALDLDWKSKVSEE